MSRFRKIEVRTWSDERFLRLSPMLPSAQSLWFYLLTGPHTGPIPGLFRAGRAGMAEELNWELKDFDKAFQEVFQEGMLKANLKAHLVWLPNALKHNKPASPNVVKSWRNELDLLPECDLKIEAIAFIMAELKNMGEAYLSAFEGILKPSAKPSAKPMPNQEQEQQQEQEQDIVVVVDAREDKKVVEKIDDPKDAMEWVSFFVNKMGFQIHEAHTATTVPMFVDWVARGVTLADVEIAHVQVSHKLDGKRPSYPTYYKNFVDTVLLEKRKDRKSQPQSKTQQPYLRGALNQPIYEYKPSQDKLDKMQVIEGEHVQ